MKKFQISLLVFTLSIIGTVSFWSVLPISWRSNESDDYIYYYEPVARQLLDGQGFTSPDGQLVDRYPPGYALILAGVFGLAQLLKMPDSTALSVFILLCTGLSSVMIFLLASEVFDLQVGFISGLLWMTYPFNVWLSKQPNSEIPFMVLFFACVFLFWRLLNSPSSSSLYFLVVGLMTGLAALIRPVALGLTFLFAGFLFVQRSLIWPTRISRVTLLMLGSLLTILPWQSLIYVKTREIIPLSTGGLISIWDGLTYAVTGSDGSHYWVPDETRNLMIMIHNRGNEVFGGSNRGLPVVLIEEAAHNPLGALQLLGLKIARSWYGTESGRLEAVNLIVQLVYLMAILWGGTVVWRSGRIQRHYLVFAVVLGLYFWLITVAVLSILRYMVPVMGLLIPLISAGFVRFLKPRSIFNPFLPFV